MRAWQALLEYLLTAGKLTLFHFTTSLLLLTLLSDATQLDLEGQWRRHLSSVNMAEEQVIFSPSFHLPLLTSQQYGKADPSATLDIRQPNALGGLRTWAELPTIIFFALALWRIGFGVLGIESRLS